jgi:hypothetical protein
MRKRWKWLVVAAVVLVVLAVGAPFVYIHLIEGAAPSKLALPTTHSTEDQRPGSGVQSAVKSGRVPNHSVAKPIARRPDVGSAVAWLLHHQLPRSVAGPRG